MHSLPANFENWSLRYAPASKIPAHLLVMLHGLTGDETSMWFFARHMPADFWIMAPRAPHAAQPAGFSWRPYNPAISFPPSVEVLRPAAIQLLDLIDRWSVANGLDTQQIDFMGFSQGGAMAVTFSLLYPQRVRKLAILAGFAPAGSETLIKGLPLKEKRIFITHGTADEMVPIEAARQTVALLEKAGAQVEYCESEVGHKVSITCNPALEAFLRS
jgi:phospholipase/carboxylesterase